MMGELMGKVIKFKQKPQHDPTTIKLVQASAELDAVILKYLNDNDIDPRELAGLIAHRLGTLMNHLEEKSELWCVCEKVLKRQAHLD
jgi:hypothetical protein